MRYGIHATAKLGPNMVLVALVAFASIASAELTLNVVDKEPPQAFDASIREVLQSKSIQLLDGDQPVYEFWFRKEVPLKKKPESTDDGLKCVAQSTLLAVAVIKKPQRDYRDDELYADTYTARFSLQPQDGNHLGTAEYPYFLALVPVKQDASLEALATYKELVKASSLKTATDHPIIQSLRPAQDVNGDYPRLNQPAPDHKSVLVKLPARAGGDSAELVFDLVYEGVSIH